MGRPAKEGESPVYEINYGAESVPEYHGAREILWESARTIS